MNCRKLAVVLSTVLLYAGTLLIGQTAPTGEQLTIPEQTLPAADAGEPFTATLAARGGVPPYKWELDSGSKLPPGLTLTVDGTLSGTPTVGGEFRFIANVTDSATQVHSAARQFAMVVSVAFSIEWRKPPTVQGDKIAGEVLVSNPTRNSVDLTVIIVAVNEIHKAFALGYQQLELPPKSKTPPIPFGSSLPYGTYVIHADAVGEVPSINRIYRARLQTKPLVIARP